MIAPGSRRQLPLPFVFSPDYRREDFLEAPSNAEALAWLARTPDWPGGRLALWGEAGCGKTHLLHLWAAANGAVLLSAPSLRGVPAPPGTPLAIDDADAPAEPAALFHLLNAAAEAGQPVLIAAREPPGRWSVALPDLASRVRAMTAIRVLAPEDTLLAALFARLLADRGLAVAEPVQRALLLRLPRAPAALREAVERLDRLSLAVGRAVTRGLAAEVLEGLDEGEKEKDARGNEVSVPCRLDTRELPPLL